MLDLIPYEPQHAVDLMRIPTMQSCDATPINIDWATQMKNAGPCISGCIDGKVVACSGISIFWEGVGEMWALFADDIGTAHLGQQPKELIKRWMKEYNLVRVQAPLIADFRAGIAYARRIGFKFETKLKWYHPGKVDALMYVIMGK